MQISHELFLNHLRESIFKKQMLFKERTELLNLYSCFWLNYGICGNLIIIIHLCAIMKFPAVIKIAVQKIANIELQRQLEAIISLFRLIHFCIKWELGFTWLSKISMKLSLKYSGVSCQLLWYNLILLIDRYNIIFAFKLTWDFYWILAKDPCYITRILLRTKCF